MQEEENTEKKRTRERETLKRETAWRTLRAFSLENEAGIEKLLPEDRGTAKLDSKCRNRKQ
jgi:hypothetical protein